MKALKIFILILLINLLCVFSFAEPIKVCINMRGTTGIEDQVKDIMSREFIAGGLVSLIDKKEECHLYLDLSVIEQAPIKFYGLGISIAYRLKEEFYGRPTSDVAQFGQGRIEEVCTHLAREISVAFLDPLREKIKNKGPASS